jgi:selenophosphate synthase
MYLRKGENARIGRIEEALGLRERLRERDRERGGGGKIKRAGIEIQGNYSIGSLEPDAGTWQIGKLNKRKKRKILRDRK